MYQGIWFFFSQPAVGMLEQSSTTERFRSDFRGVLHIVVPVQTAEQGALKECLSVPPITELACSSNSQWLGIGGLFCLG